MNLFSFDDEATWAPPSALPSLPSSTVAIDIETFDEGLSAGQGSSWPWGGGFVVGIALAWRAGDRIETAYLPLRHVGASNLDPSLVLRWLAEEFRDESKTWVVMNASYDFGWLGMIPQRFHDIAIMAPLLDEYLSSYSLQAIAEHWLKERKGTDDLTSKAAELGFMSKASVFSNMHRLPVSLVARYAMRDAELTLRLHDVLLPKIMASSLKQAFELETRLVRVIIEMRRRGVRIDETRLAVLIDRYKRRLIETRERLRQAAGRYIEPWVAADVAEALRATGIEVPLTDTGVPSIRKEWLTALADKGNEVASLVLQMRNIEKVRSTFLEGYFAANIRNGRVFPEFHSLRMERGDGGSYGTVSYRFSSSHPNFQNLPGRAAEATRDVRGLVLPEEGELWISGDYSQQEPRLALHYALSIDAPGAKDAFARLQAAGDAWDFHSDAAAIVGIPRKEVKGISLGRMYGAGPVTIAKLLGLPVKKELRLGEWVEVPGQEAIALLQQYDERFPWIRYTSDFFRSRAQAVGELQLLGGYRSRFSIKGKKEHARGDLPHKAFNRLVQGSAAAQTKQAMLLYVEMTGRFPLITLHDEIGVSGQPDKEGKMLAHALSSAFADVLRVPFRADIETGSSWGAAALGEEA